MKKYKYVLLIFYITCHCTQAQKITITVDAGKDLKPISPWIYGKNNSVSDDPGSWKKYREAGLRMYRENGGNNATKYNWRLKLTSHPDWYNNVYAADWDKSATSILSQTDNTQGFYALQLLGKAASTNQYNFNDWAYDQSQGTNKNENWAGGGGPGITGNPTLYLEDWTADSTTGIFDHWFNKLHLDSTRLRYWNMDNEPEIWKDTHDDVASSAITAEDFMQKYFAAAKAARKKFPGIRLVGPVSPNEWQWYNWNNTKVKDQKTGLEYPWMEYFIKRIAEEQQATGIRLLDVLDVHFYPGSKDPDLTLQLHRIWFDTQWNYPGANGVKVTAANGWDNNITKEYFFERCSQWLSKYMGAGHGVHFGVSEYGAIDGSNANVVACWYASHLGTFANKGIELFTPWDWYPGQWEVLNLFSNYFGTVSAQSISDVEETVSGYAALSHDGDSLTIAVVNKDRASSRNVEIDIRNFVPSLAQVNGFQLSDLPASETFISKSDNKLQTKQFLISNKILAFTAPALSVTLIQVPSDQPVSTGTTAALHENLFLYPNPVKDKLRILRAKNVRYEVVVSNILGQQLLSSVFEGTGELDLSRLAIGNYIVQVIAEGAQTTQLIYKE